MRLINCMKIIATIVVVILMFSCKTIPTVKSPSLVGQPPEDTTVFVVDNEPSNESIATFLTEYLKIKYKDRDFSKFIYVSIKHQKLYLIEKDSVRFKFPISSAKLGVGNVQNSMKTPIGLHTIKHKYGDDVPLAGLFKSRVYTGNVSPIYAQKIKSPTDDVTTRIMWLQGEEPGINKGRNIDSYKRYIYIHGTSEEGYIGEPASHGCIRMKNTDVLNLYEVVDEGTPVLILKY
ncbi:L,D-transpeptidase [Vicingus serpentipes]|uniref:L,D-transpeptidase n=2 Tax=Vicingus serpentipes TaxID=1926625 RepID=A0A5C6RSY2_9FLAO|nr:L,D-transpeptidase [Vicingus serpentipes]